MPWRAPTWFDRLGGVAWRVVAIAAAAAVVVVGALGLSPILVPVVLGLLVACGLHPVAERHRRQGVPRGLASGLPILGLVGLLGAIGWLVGTTVVEQWGQISDLMAAVPVTTTVVHALAELRAAGIVGPATSTSRAAVARPVPAGDSPRAG